MAAISQERDFDANPYSPDEERAAAYMRRLLPNVGTGDDPIGFVLASWEQMVAERKSLRGRLLRSGWLTPFAGLRSFISGHVEDVRDDIFAIEQSTHARIHTTRAEVASVKATVLARLDAFEEAIRSLDARLTGPAAPAPSLILPDSPVAERRVPRSTWEPGAGAEAARPTDNPLGDRPHP